MPDDWINRTPILTTKTLEPKRRTAVVRGYTTGKIRIYKSTRIVEDNFTIRCSREILNKIALGSNFPDQNATVNKYPISTLLGIIDIQNRLVDGRTYVEEDMSNQTLHPLIQAGIRKTRS